MESLSILRCTSLRVTAALSMATRQVTSEVVVSGGTLSANVTRRRAPSIAAMVTLTESVDKSTSGTLTCTRSTVPRTTALSIIPAVLSFSLFTSNSSTTTLLRNKGNRRTLTCIRSTSAMVSVGGTARRFCTVAESLGICIRKPSTQRSRGNESNTRPTLTCIPVGSDTLSVTYCTTAFCTGGR